MGKLAALKKALDMSKEARMDRAREMGFDTDTVYYHGTSADIKEFDPRLRGTHTKARSARQGDFFTKDSETANAYAEISRDMAEHNLFDLIDKARFQDRGLTAERAFHKDDYETLLKLFPEENAQNLIKQAQSAAPNVIPVYLRKGSQKTYDAQGKSYEDIRDEGGLGSIVENAKSNKFDSLEIKNFDDNPYIGHYPQDHQVVFDPKNIRSVNAAFDPAKKDSSNLLAGVTGATVSAGALLPEEAAADFTQRRATKKDQWKQHREQLFGPSPIDYMGGPVTVPQQRIEAPKSQTLLDMARGAQAYNDFVDKPLINLVAPKLPAELWRKQAYGQPTTLGERSWAALEMLP